MDLTTLFDQAIELKASDIHLSTGEVPVVRIAGKLVRLGGERLNFESMAALLDQFLPIESRARMEVGLSAERTVVHGEQAFVGVAFKCDSDGVAVTFRVLAKGIPDLDVIAEGALPFFETLAEQTHGLVLVTGPTISGKWTTACSIVDRINRTKPARIFIVEAHPNYRFVSQFGLVTQLHVGQDLDSYARALEVAHQADLDVIAIDDITTTETLRSMLILAETGHLVIANLHSDGAVEALRKLLEGEGTQPEALRMALSKNLVAVTGQRLFPRKTRPGRVPAYEWIQMSPEIRKALTEGDLDEILRLQSTLPECQSLESAKATLVAAGEIEAE